MTVSFKASTLTKSQFRAVRILFPAGSGITKLLDPICINLLDPISFLPVCKITTTGAGEIQFLINGIAEKANDATYLSFNINNFAGLSTADSAKAVTA